MSKRPPRLGRGLESLIGSADFSVAEPQPVSRPAPASVPVAPTGPVVQSIPLGRIEPNPFQPRQQFDDTGLAELAQSIKTDGILQPITLRQVESRYQIIAGERRWRAAQLAGLTEIPAIVRAADDNEMLVLALVENIQREDLNAIEKAQAYEALRRTLNMPIEQLARRLGQDRSTVSNYLRLLELDESLQSQIRSGQLSMGHARALLARRGAPNSTRAEHIAARSVGPCDRASGAATAGRQASREGGGAPAARTAAGGAFRAVAGGSDADPGRAPGQERPDRDLLSDPR